jgi:3-hydroxyisobutyrate dehydrogenase
MVGMRVALLGTGIMGAGMAASLLRSGHEVTVWNRTLEKAEPLAGAGARLAGNPADAVSGAEVVLTMLFDADSVLEVMSEAVHGLADDAVWAQCSTVGVDGTHRAAALADGHDVAFVDAPMLGTRKPAENGQLVVLAAGPDDLQEWLQPVFDAVGSRTVWVSDRVGDASALKLVCNAWIGSLTAAVGQSIALAEGLGLDPSLFLAAIRGGAVDSPYAQTKGLAMIEREFATQFAVDGVVKDLGLIGDAARSAAVSTTLVDAVRGCFEVAADRGHGAEDMAAVVTAFPTNPG